MNQGAEEAVFSPRIHEGNEDEGFGRGLHGDVGPDSAEPEHSPDRSPITEPLLSAGRLVSMVTAACHRRPSTGRRLGQSAPGSRHFDYSD